MSSKGRKIGNGDDGIFAVPETKSAEFIFLFSAIGGIFTAKNGFFLFTPKNLYAIMFGKYN